MYIPPDALEQFIKEKYPEGRDRIIAVSYIGEFLIWVERQYEGRNEVC